MSLLGGIFSDFLDQPWEQARGYIREELQQLRTALQKQSATGASALSIEGDSTVTPRYVANTGTANAPKWDRVDLVNGVTGKISYARLPTATLSTLLGRRSSANGDYEPITLGTNLSMSGTTLNASGGGGGAGDDTLMWLGL